jgi:predicted RNase H-like nuclease (RuvC/YqgF family)
MQNNNSQQLAQVCSDMAEAGVTPTVGLLRAKAPFKVSVTEAIDAIKYFNATSKNQGKAKPKDKEPSLASLSRKVDALEATVQRLEQQIRSLLDSQK